MSKLYKIRLTNAETTAEIHQRLPDGRMVRVPARLRNIELEVIDKCYEQLSINCRTVSDYLQCIRIMDLMQSIPDSVEFIHLKKADLENLLNGFVLTAGKRPDSWARARMLFEQFLAPEEIDVAN